MRAAATYVFASAFALFSLVSCTTLTGADALDVEGVQEPAPERDTSPTKPDQQGSEGAVVIGGSSSATSPSSSTNTSDTPGSSSPKRALSCDGFQCSGATPHCCQRAHARGQCVGVDDACDGVRLSCSGKDDCSAGDVCCGLGSASVARCTKASECVAQEHRVLCLEDSDCPGGRTCGDPDGAYDHPVCR